MTRDQQQSCASSVVGALIVAVPCAIFMRHDLVESKPYKIMASPLREELASAATWLPVVVLIVAFLTGVVAVRWRPVVQVGLAIVMTIFVSLGSVVILTIAFGQGVPTGGDFGTRAVVTEFSKLLARTTIISAVLALIVATFTRAFRRIPSQTG